MLRYGEIEDAEMTNASCTSIESEIGRALIGR
jgi:hypothetical protein